MQTNGAPFFDQIAKYGNPVKSNSSIGSSLSFSFKYILFDCIFCIIIASFSKLFSSKYILLSFNISSFKRALLISPSSNSNIPISFSSFSNSK